MKITLITQYYKPEMGAPQNRLYEMCTGLHKLGCDVSVITGMPNYPTGSIFPGYKGKFTQTEVIDDLEVKRYWLYASNSKNAFPRILNMLSFSFSSLFSLRYLSKRKNDLIIVESPPLTLGLTGVFLKCCTKSKLVFNVSDLWPLSARELGAISGDGLIYKILEKLERYLYKKSALCIGQSQEIVNYIKEHGANDAYLFRNGVDPNRFQIKKVENTFNADSKLKIVYTGLLGFAQGILNICENVNFEEMGAEFHIYGAGGEQKQIEEYIVNNSKSGIFYHGKVSREEIPNVLSKADCTLIPLVKNIFGAVPSKIYESMAAGLPILFSGEGEGKRIVIENNLGWVSKPKNYAELKENIISIVNNRSEFENKKNNCLYCASNLFNRPKQIKALYEYLLKL